MFYGKIKCSNLPKTQFNTDHKPWLFFVCPLPATPTLGHAGCRILVPWLGVEPGRLAMKAPSPNHWTARELYENKNPVKIFKDIYKS